MKKILVVGLALALSAGLTNQLYAQSESTALSLAQQHDARGSARYQALAERWGLLEQTLVVFIRTQQDYPISVRVQSLV